jgi:endonuclease/exonuclease/phosphatase family metal-dependent hydrolase
MRSHQRLSLQTAAALATLVALAAGCSDSTTPADGPTGDSADPVTLTVMTYNIQLAGTAREPIERTIEILRTLDPDVIGFQELGTSAESIADALGYQLYVTPGGGYIPNSAGIMTRFDIAATFDAGVELDVPGAPPVFVFDTHLQSFPYQPYDLRDGKLTDAEEAIAAADEARGEAMQAILDGMGSALDDGSAVFLTGDFNEPSHLDWTDEAASLHLGMKVEWPTSLRVQDAGLVDAYRSLNPNPVSAPGSTWTPFATDDDEVHDRLDFVYFAGDGVRVKRAQIVGESSEFADIVESPWPSDHRAVIVEVELPTLTAPDAR